MTRRYDIMVWRTLAQNNDRSNKTEFSVQRFAEGIFEKLAHFSILGGKFPRA